MRTNYGYVSPTTKSAGDTSITEGGLTLRDYFAAKVVQGLAVELAKQPLGNVMDRGAKIASRIAYIVADEMLKAREQEEG